MLPRLLLAYDKINILNLSIRHYLFTRVKSQARFGAILNTN